jgi:hypothetical protein
MDRRTLLSIAIALLGWMLPSCDGEPPSPVPVRGKVYYRNAPLRGGILVFTPDPLLNGDGPMSHAEIQADGTYTLRTENSLGAIPGRHRVTVTTLPESPLQLPARYGDPEKSGLHFDVKPGRENIIDIYLE